MNTFNNKTHVLDSILQSLVAHPNKKTEFAHIEDETGATSRQIQEAVDTITTHFKDTVTFAATHESITLVHGIGDLQSFLVQGGFRHQN